MQNKEITVVGLGYIGLPTAVVMAEAGHKVKGYDAKPEVRECLKAGTIHIVENGLQEAYEKVAQEGRLVVTDEIVRADIYIICVPTPFLETKGEKKADLMYVEEAARSVAKLLKKGDLVILESTVPPHTTAHLTEILSDVSGLSKDAFFTAHCPERVLPGRILHELKHNDRIIGSEDVRAAQMTKELYETFVIGGTCYVCDDVTAELCKLAENTYRDINIAYANQLSVICRESGIDVFRLIELANKHPRVNILTPGLGVGGHCLAVDPWFIVEKYGENASLIRTAREINERKPLWVTEEIGKALEEDEKPFKSQSNTKESSKEAKRIGIMGMAYKPDIDDMRESPSLLLAQELKKAGYETAGYEPNSAAGEVEGVSLCSLWHILDTSDYLVIALGHKELQDVRVKERMKQIPHYDCIGLLREEVYE